MRLLCCHIENFGRLRDFDHDFVNGKNILFEENGWGKSTLASFIRIMFYGFSGDGKQKELVNERKRFAPWQNGTFGGSITFEIKDNRYRAERLFDTKKQADDEFRLYNADTNIEVSDYSSNLGNEIFGIDAESFERTVFIAQQDCGTSVTSGINAKMGNIADETADMGNYEDVQAKLKKELLHLDPVRKTGELKKLENRIAELSSMIMGKTAQQHTLDELRTALIAKQNLKKSDEERIAAIQSKINELGKIKDIRAQYEKYDGLKKAVEESEEKTGELASYFPGDIPDDDKVGNALNDYDKYEAAKRSAADLELSADNADRLRRYADEFETGVPDEAELASAAKDAAEIAKLKMDKAGNSLSDNEEKRRADDERYFSLYMPKEGEISRLIDDMDDADNLRASLSSKKANADFMRNLSEKNRQKEKSKSKSLVIFGIVMLIISAALITGAVLISPGDFTAVILILGVVCAVTGIALLFSGHRHDTSSGANDSSYDALVSEIEEDEKDIADAEDRAKSLFDRMNLTYSRADVYSELHTMKQRIREYEDLEDRYNDFRGKDFDGRISEKRGNVISFVEKYYPGSTDDELTDKIGQIRFDAKEYGRLKKQKEDCTAAEAKAADYMSLVTEFAASLKIEAASDIKKQLMEIRDRLLQIAEQKVWLEKRRAELGEFENNYDISQLDVIKKQALSTADADSLQKLTDEFNDLKSEIDDVTLRINEYRSQIDDASEVMEQIGNDETELEQCRERYTEFKHRYDVISRTSDMLNQAKTDFTGRYMNPIKESFDKYYHMISPDNSVYELDANLNIRLREEGSLHETELLSEGYKDLVGLCRRMAMVDAMYSGAKPFLVFDDPFVNLDDVRLAGAMRFLDSIAKEYQVIYLVCSSGRR